MENASKALIIAGAILISILLISVGIIVMNAINDPVQEGANSAKSQAVEIFNGKFTGYMGPQTYTTVKALYTAAQSQAGSHKITMTPAKLSDVSTTAKSYMVSATGWDSEGYINAITVTAK